MMPNIIILLEKINATERPVRLMDVEDNGRAVTYIFNSSSPHQRDGEEDGRD